MIVPIDAELLDNLISLAEAHVRRMESQRTTPANRRVKKEVRQFVEEAKDLLHEYTDHLKKE